ncbi:MAG: hypothetical protein K6G62_05855 [Eubacterium sp.]|nr:hypothetical protein [Eubacterium sp.]
MKKLSTLLLLTLATLFLCSCGQGGPAQVTGTPAGQKRGGGPVSAAAVEDVSETEAFNMAEEIVKNMSLEDKVGQMFMVNLSELDDPEGSMYSYEATQDMIDALGRYKVGGVILEKRNVKSRRQTVKLTMDLQKAVSGPALYVAVEEDGGGDYSISAEVSDLTAGGYNTPAEMGSKMSDVQIEQQGFAIGRQLRGFGINMNLSPVADLSYNKNAEYDKRCLGGDEAEVAELLTAYVEGYRRANMAVTLKYFPGMGQVSGEAENVFLENDQTLMELRENELSVYAEGISAGADCVMVGNVHMTKLVEDRIPAFMSSEVVTKLLREELSFDRVVMTAPLNDSAITDNFSQAYAVTKAAGAGCDLMVKPANLGQAYKALINAVKRGKISEKEINTSVRRILTDKIRRGIVKVNNNEN